MLIFQNMVKIVIIGVNHISEAILKKAIDNLKKMNKVVLFSSSEGSMGIKFL